MQYLSLATDKDWFRSHSTQEFTIRSLNLVHYLVAHPSGSRENQSLIREIFIAVMIYSFN